MNLSSYYAVKFIKRSKVQSLVIILGLALGVAVLVVMTWLVSGIGLALDEAYAGGLPHVVVRGVGGLTQEIERVEALTNTLKEELSGLEAITPVLELPVVISVPATGMGPASREADENALRLHTLVRGIELERAGRLYPLGGAMVRGRTFLQARETVVGLELAEAMGLRVGDTLVMDNEEGRTVQFAVVGIYDLKHEALNTSQIFTGLSALQGAFGKPGEAQSIELQLKDSFAEEVAADQIGTIAKAMGLEIGTDLEVRSWQQTHSAIYSAAVLERRSVSLLVGAVSLIILIGFVLVLSLAVRQLLPRLAVFETMGLSKTHSAMVAVLYALYLSLLGVLGGGVLGSGLVSVYNRLAVAGVEVFRPLPDPAVSELVLILTALPLVTAFAAWMLTWRVLDHASAEVIYHG
ncbi:ABC transporter permease [Acidaminobacter hydrogenoformans]|uniref:ABC-type transport system, involved in lipoprotein release, permease component n=1 Tax=Acidaminobacter hydrogenoformans DSM 2784 TaxID=1120920 RepID=A0A1G5S5V1_9FIRM|nr:ABC transporter permease [Acidaminobacter hydrogenoformans]SCZ81487.1 ABC-type transport system, involved in lipoprotein release, permease component [Acidaminobacter hydrogenoformans DSM 2784]